MKFKRIRDLREDNNYTQSGRNAAFCYKYYSLLIYSIVGVIF